MNNQKTPSRTSPKGKGRGCYCKDSNTYSRKCCDGSLWAQGIGSLSGNNTSIIIRGQEWEEIISNWEDLNNFWENGL